MAKKKTTRKKKSKKRGRKEVYRKSYCKRLIKYFDVEPYTDKPLPHYKTVGKKKNLVWTDYKRMANRLPTLRGFAKYIGVHIATVYRWISEKSNTYHEEFSDAFTQAQELRKWFLIENGLNGSYNSNFAIFVAKNITDMTDTTKQEGKFDHNINVTIVDFKDVDTEQPISEPPDEV